MAAAVMKTTDMVEEQRASIEKGEAFTVQMRELPELLRDLTPEELRECEKKLVRKIDMRLLPALILIYIMNYLDRYAIEERLPAIVFYMFILLKIRLGTLSVRLV